MIDMNTTNTQLRQAALLIASLDQATADALLDQLAPNEADLVRRMLVSLEEIDAAEQDAAIGQFLGFEEPADDQQGAVTMELTRSQELTRSPPVHQEPPFRFLHEASSSQLLPLLRGEHPQTVAVVVSYLPPESAAQLLSDLPTPLQADVMRRLADLEETDPAILREVEAWLQERLVRRIGTDRRRSAGLSALADILSAADAGHQQRLRASLSQHAPQLARLLPSPQVELCFDDLWFLDRAALRHLLNEADSQTVTLALAGARHSVVEWLLRQLSDQEAQDLRQAWKRLGPTPLSDIEQAQQDLVQLAIELGLSPREEHAAAA